MTILLPLLGMYARAGEPPAETLARVLEETQQLRKLAEAQREELAAQADLVTMVMAQSLEGESPEDAAERLQENTDYLGQMNALLEPHKAEGDRPLDTLARVLVLAGATQAYMDETSAAGFHRSLRQILHDAGETDPAATARQVLSQINEFARTTMTIPHNAALALMRATE